MRNKYIDRLDAIIQQYMKVQDISVETMKNLISNFANYSRIPIHGLQNVIDTDFKNYKCGDPVFHISYPSGQIDYTPYDTYDSYTKAAFIWYLNKFSIDHHVVHYGAKKVKRFNKASVTEFDRFGDDDNHIYPNRILLIHYYSSDKFADDDIIDRFKPYQFTTSIKLYTSPESISYTMSRLKMLPSLEDYVMDSLMHKFKDMPVSEIGSNQIKSEFVEATHCISAEIYNNEGFLNPISFSIQPHEKIFIINTNGVLDDVIIYISKSSLLKEYLQV